MSRIRQRLLEITMKTKRLFNFEKTDTVTCDKCKFGYLVDKRNAKYYCIPPNGRCWLYYGNHSCGSGEKRQ